MEIYSGKTIYEGTVIGKIHYYSKHRNQIKQECINSCGDEIGRFKVAKEKAKEQFGILRDKAATEVGKNGAMIFEAYAMLLDDSKYSDSVIDVINKEHANAEYAVAVAGNNLADMFAQMDDEYFRARAVDIKDISDRVIDILQNENTDVDVPQEPVIFVADDITPCETVQLDKSKLLSFVTRRGSTNSHTAILARTMNLPSLVGVEIDEKWNGKLAIVDGVGGRLIVEPDEETLAKYKAIAESERESIESMKELKGKPNVTLDGKEISLYANVGNVSDVTAALENEADGVGLFRSEFLYLEKSDYPTEEELFESYKSVAHKMDGRRVVIRTLDIGADKQAEYFNLEKEENPALGYRAIRICLDRTDLFKTQLRAIYRASAYGKIAIMFPMIVSLDEVLKIKSICEDVKAELKKDGLAYSEVELGIMIETPAAVMISDILAEEVDFFSIGTNDLTQFTLAIDRQNPKLDKYYDPHHEALFRMIKLVIDNGHASGCRVAVCGELAADATITEKLIQLGVDELSVSSPFILPVRKAIRESVSQ